MKATWKALTNLQAKMSRALKTKVREDDGMLTAEIFRRKNRKGTPYLITIACFAPIWNGSPRSGVIISVQLCLNGKVFYVSETPHERDAVDLCANLRGIVRELAR